MNRMNPYWPAALLLAVLVVSMWASPAQAGDPWADLLSASDANGDGAIQQNEAPPRKGISTAFAGIDTDKDGSIGKEEYEEFIFNATYRGGIVSGKVAEFVTNSTRDVMVNYGAGPSKNLRAKDLKVPEPYGTRGIFVAVKPADLDLYKSLLTEPYRFPAEPTVTYILLNYGSYYEGMVMLKADCPDGAETWVVLSMPVHDRLMLVMGHSWGFPKYVADEVKLTKTSAVVTYEGEVQYSLTLTPGGWDDESSAIEPEGGAYGINNMAVFHPTPDGPKPIRFTYGTVSTQEQKKGMVKIEVNPKAPWAGLIPNGTVAPGMWQRFVGVTDSSIIKVKS